MKIGSKSAKELAADATAFEKLFNFLNPVTLVAIFIFALNVLAYRKALDAFKLNVAYPIMVSVGMVLVIMAAWALPALKERLSWPQLVGVALIAVGLWLLTAYAGADAASAPRP
jgi:multidrug transporter EmrE-like cation transporter